jgi:hypothetical protein
MVDDADGARLCPPGQDGCNHEVAGRQIQGRQFGDNLNTGRIKAHLLLRLPQSRRDRPGVNGIDRTTWEGDLTRVRTHAVRSLGQHYILATLGARSEEDQHCGRPTTLVRGQEPAEEARILLTQLRHQVRHPLRLLDGHD